MELTELQLTGVSLTSASIAGLSEMATLEELYLRWDQFAEFPAQLAMLSKLRKLSIYSDRDVPDTVGDFQSLRYLGLGYAEAVETSGMQPVSKRLGDLHGLEELVLERLNLRDVYPAIFTLTGLRDLSLVQCGLDELSPAIASLVHLEELNLNGNCLGSLPSELFSLSNISSLWIPNTRIGELSEDVGRLSQLKSLHIGECELKSLPAAVATLGRLTLLRANNNKITALPSGLTRLKELEILGLNHNLLTQFPRELVFLPKLRDLDLKDNPLSDPPPEIAGKGTRALQDYFSALVLGPPEHLHEAKILIVGEGGVGKTRLAGALIQHEPSGEQYRDELRSTEGIDIREWRIANALTADFRINLWDFGGQEIYHATHQFFLTKRSLYLFVWDARKEDRTGGFDYWLNIIRLLSAGSPVIVVLNKSDQRVREIDESELKRHFPNILEFHKVSARTGVGIEVLRERVKEIAATLPHVGDQWPATWSSVRRSLEEAPQEHITRDEYEDICRAVNIPNSQMSSLSSYLHDLGVILHFQDDPLLQRIVILKPEWGTNAVYKVLDTRTVQDAKGRFTLTDLRSIWGSAKYSPVYHPELLQLMIKFELCFPLGASGSYVAPELLSAEMPELNWDSSGNLVFEYHYVFMPAGIITRFIARMHGAIEGDKYWRNGVVLKWRGTRARVVAEPLNRRIHVAVNGTNCRELLSVVRHQIDEIHRTLNEPRVSEMVPCNCVQCQTHAPHLFAFSTLEAYLAKGLEEIRCEKSLENASIRKLIAEVSAPSAVNQATAAGHRVYSIGSIGRVDRLYIENKPLIQEKTMKVRSNNPWVSGSFYLLVVIVVFAVLLAVGRLLSPWWLPVLIVGGLLLVTVVGAFQLKNDDKLADASFLKLLQLAFKQLPLIGRVAPRQGRE
jgi:internalin A